MSRSTSRGRPSARASGDGAVALAQVGDLGLGRPGDALHADPEPLDQAPQRRPLLVHGPVVALDGHKLGHRPPRDRLALARPPVAPRPSGWASVRGVVQEGRGHDVGPHPEVAAGQLAEGLGEP